MDDEFGSLDSEEEEFESQDPISIASSFESSEEQIDVLNQDAGGEGSNIFTGQNQITTPKPQEDWYADDDGTGMGTSTILVLAVGVIAIFFLWRRRSASSETRPSGSRGGYRPVPGRHRKD
jgi:hypothetical protein